MRAIEVKRSESGSYTMIPGAEDFDFSDLEPLDTAYIEDLYNWGDWRQAWEGVDLFGERCYYFVK